MHRATTPPFGATSLTPDASTKDRRSDDDEEEEEEEEDERRMEALSSGKDSFEAASSSYSKSPSTSRLSSRFTLWFSHRVSYRLLSLLVFLSFSNFLRVFFVHFRFFSRPPSCPSICAIGLSHSPFSHLFVLPAYTFRSVSPSASLSCPNVPLAKKLSFLLSNVTSDYRRISLDNLYAHTHAHTERTHVR